VEQVVLFLGVFEKLLERKMFGINNQYHQKSIEKSFKLKQKQIVSGYIYDPLSTSDLSQHQYKELVIKSYRY